MAGYGITNACMVSTLKVEFYVQYNHIRRKFVPLEFGEPPRDIAKHMAGFKAKEWSNFVTLHSLPLLLNHLPMK
jgi:hypothetical protein